MLKNRSKMISMCMVCARKQRKKQTKNPTPRKGKKKRQSGKCATSFGIILWRDVLAQKAQILKYLVETMQFGRFCFISVLAVPCATEDTDSMKEKSAAGTGSHRECREFLWQLKAVWRLQKNPILNICYLKWSKRIFSFYSWIFIQN